MNVVPRSSSKTIRAQRRTSRFLVRLAVVAVVLNGCGAVRSLAQSVGRDEGAINEVMRTVVAASAHSENDLRSAAERAGAVIDGAITPLLKNPASEEAKAARSAFTQLACNAIAEDVQTGRWPTANELERSIGDELLNEIEPGRGPAKTAASALSAAQSLWTSSPIDDEVVRNVVCAAVKI